jgi:CRP-like cAMP-binding protein
MKNNAIQAIQGSTFFQGLSVTAAEELASLCRRDEFRKRDIIFSENTKGDLIYLLTEGAVQLQKTTLDGNEIVIRTVKPGEIFAEVILFEQDRYPVTAAALVPSTVYCFNRKDILGLLEHSDFRNDFIKNLMQKMRYLAERVRYLTSYDVEQRFFMFLREHYGENSVITPDIPKKDLAAAIGSTPETFSRLTKRLQDTGAITWEGKSIEIPESTWEKY